MHLSVLNLHLAETLSTANKAFQPVDAPHESKTIAESLLGGTSLHKRSFMQQSESNQKDMC